MEAGTGDFDKPGGGDVGKVQVIQQKGCHFAHGCLPHAHGRLQACIPQLAPHKALQFRQTLLSTLQMIGGEDIELQGID